MPPSTSAWSSTTPTTTGLEWLAEGGVPFLLMLRPWPCGRCGRPSAPSGESGCSRSLLHALVDYPMQRLGLALWVFVLLGVLAAEERARRVSTPIPD